MYRKRNAKAFFCLQTGKNKVNSVCCSACSDPTPILQYFQKERRMRICIVVGFLLFTFEAVAEPQLSGTAKELATYLNGVIKTVTISSTADKIVVPDKAILTLIVKNENKSLTRALKDNTDIRDKIKTQSEMVGIKSNNIRDSKFSLTPRLGLFGEKPNSYIVKNLVTIEITSEQQMVKLASIIDRDKNLFHFSTTTEISDKESEFNLLLDKALENIKKKVVIYQNKLKVELSPISFVESVENKMEFLCKKTDTIITTHNKEADKNVCGLGATMLSTTVSVSYQVYPLSIK